MSRETLKLYWQASKGNRKLAFANLFMASLGVLSGQVLLNAVFALVLNKISVGESNFNQYIALIGLYAALALIELIAWRASVWFIWEFELRLRQNLNDTVFWYLARQTQDFHNNRFGGWLVSQASKFISTSERMYDTITFDIVTGITFLVASLGFLFIKVPLYALCVTAIMVLFLFVARWLTTRQRPYNVAEAEAESGITARLADALTNIGTVIAFSSAKKEQRIYQKSVNNFIKKSKVLRNVAIQTDTGTNLFTTSLAVFSVIGAVAAYTKFGVAVGTAYLIVSYTLNICRRMWELNKIMRGFNRYFGDAYAMTNMLINEPITIVDSPAAKELMPSDSSISFKNVKFSYENNPDKIDDVFNNFNLDIKAGEKIGLVGVSGGGKTTVTKLILRLYEIQSGIISIGQQNISNVTLLSLRQNIAYVPQEPLLFHRSLSENIGYGKSGASKNEIIDAAKQAHAHEFITGLPDGYDTLVGERGVKLSGGQRQRIVIARAILKDAPILILDEATSALDSESEKLIQDALNKLMKNRTSIVIAHRLSTIQKMDRIIVLDKGKIAEQGTHKELIEKSGIYAKLWAHQSGGFLED